MMNIYSARGTKVVFAYPDNGYTYDKALAALHMKVGETYTVDWTDVSSCHTSVYLLEFPGVAFNSVLFD